MQADRCTLSSYKGFKVGKIPKMQTWIPLGGGRGGLVPRPREGKNFSYQKVFSKMVQNDLKCKKQKKIRRGGSNEYHNLCFWVPTIYYFEQKYEK